MKLPARLRWPSLPISAQILCLLLGGLAAGQVATLALTLFLPPAPPQQHSLADVAKALRGATAAAQESRPLVRSVETAPPSLQSPGWVVSPGSTRELAGLLKVSESDVRLLFYAPPPLAGAAPPPPPRQASTTRLATASFFVFQQDMGGGPGGGGPGPGGFPGGPGGFPGGGPGGFQTGGGPPGGPMTSGSFGGDPGQGTGPATGSWSGPPQGGHLSGQHGMPDRTGGMDGPGGARPAGSPEPPWRGMASAPDRGTMSTGPGPGGPRGTVVRREGPGDGAAMRPPPAMGSGPDTRASNPMQRAIPIRPPLDAAIFAPTVVTTTVETKAPSSPRPKPAPAPQALEPATTVSLPPPVTAARALTPTEPLTGPPALASTQPAVAAAAPPVTPGRQLPPPQAHGLLGIAPQPYLEGEFVAALRTGPNQWVTVRPQPEGFPNSWQRRVLLWFAVSFALVAPVGWFVARRLAAPLRDFALAAERLGMDPSAPVSTLQGPAEVGRAARAFNQMQARLKRYVEDRTGMIGAISHDLRTPLARMRFRLERAPPELKESMGRDIAQMEAMITSVLSFMRDDASNTPRERVDLRSILECVVDDAGGEIDLRPGGAAEVEVDVIGIQRVFENLVDNALKYGERAQVRLFQEGGEAVAEIADHGPGLPEAELEQIFKPFYRGAAAKDSGKRGIGLGLAVSRSTVRAHGGELRLARAPDGLVAQVRLPLTRTASKAA